MKDDISNKLAKDNKKIAIATDIEINTVIKAVETINKGKKAYEDYKNSLLNQEEKSYIETSNNDEDEEKDGNAIATTNSDNEVESDSTNTDSKRTSGNDSSNKGQNKGSKIATSTISDEFLNEDVESNKTSRIKTSVIDDEISEDVVNNESSAVKTSVINEVMQMGTNAIQTRKNGLQEQINEKVQTNKEEGKIKSKGKNKKYRSKLHKVARVQQRATNIMTSINEGKDVQKQIVKDTSKTVGRKVAKKVTKKPVKAVERTVTKMIKALTKIIIGIIKKIVLALASAFPFAIAFGLMVTAVLGFTSVFQWGSSENANDIFSKYETYIAEKTNEYSEQITSFQAEDVDYVVEGYSNIDWKTPLAILQVLGGDLTFDDAERNLMNEFYNAKMFEEHTITEKTIQKETTDENGNKVTTDKVIKIMTITNKGYDDYISWCNSHKDKILAYQQAKKTNSKNGDGTLTTDETETLQLLATSEFFFDGASDSFKSLVQNQLAPDSTVIQNGTIAEKAVEYGKSKLGALYWWGTAGPTYFDCSGFVSWCYNQSGANVGRQTTTTFAKMGKAVPKDKSQLKVGDLIITSGHVVMYIGNGEIIGANGGTSKTHGDNPNARVSIKKMDYYFNKAIAIRRLVE